MLYSGVICKRREACLACMHVQTNLAPRVSPVHAFVQPVACRAEVGCKAPAPARIKRACVKRDGRAKEGGSSLGQRLSLLPASRMVDAQVQAICFAVRLGIATQAQHVAAVEGVDGKGCTTTSPPAHHGNAPVAPAVKGAIDATNISA